ncbi:MAG TPA: septal ring lytic transglycosylase RlpA family protein [Candidatus Binatia bacterium]|nr:septal ring lytic transglycosylase RlpA family protein [Candidatus Binatia bacterium]
MLVLGLASLALIAPGCAATRKPTRAAAPPPGTRIVGLASWYGQRHQGRATASGEAFNMNLLTAAHRTMPFGTRLRVTNVENGRSVVVRVNDRGPWVNDRVLDVSLAAAKALGIVGDGVTRVEIVVIE